MNTVHREIRQTAVSRAIWPWAEPAADGADEPHTARPAMIRAAILAAVAALLAFGLHLYHMAVAVACVGTVLLVTGTWAPPVFRAIDRAFLAFGRWVGIGFSWLLLVPVFYLCFAPARLVLKLRGIDPMHRRHSPDIASYWTAYAPHKHKDRYRKQW